MQDWRSLSHVRWECKYHVVIAPKYRKKVFYGRKRRKIGWTWRVSCVVACIPSEALRRVSWDRSVSMIDNPISGPSDRSVLGIEMGRTC